MCTRSHFFNNSASQNSELTVAFCISEDYFWKPQARAAARAKQLIHPNGETLLSNFLFMKKSKRRTTTTSANLVQYKTMLKQSLIPINRHLAALDKRFVEVDQNFKVVNGKLAAFVGINSLNIDRAINGLEKRHDEKFDAIMKKMDGFLKRTEDNEREIMFLGKQHDNLAKYCNEKIAYPEYGRKL